MDRARTPVNVTRGVHWNPPAEKRVNAAASAGYLCPDCGAALEIERGVTFSTFAGGRQRISRSHWCQACGASLTVVYRASGSELKITVEKAGT